MILSLLCFFFQKVWRITGWATENKIISEAIDQLKEILWGLDYVILAGNGYEPDQHIRQFLASKQDSDIQNLECRSIHQLYLPEKNSLNIQIR